MNYNLILQTAEEKGFTIRKLCQLANISEPGFYKMIKNNSMKIGYLEDISDVLKVSPSYFFTQNSDEKNIVYEKKYRSTNGNNDSKSIDNSISLKSIISDKEEIISLLREKEDIYKERNEELKNKVDELKAKIGEMRLQIEHLKQQNNKNTGDESQNTKTA